MVGFGSSLRMARRTGWERAYLDYETLKMLLSQIEAVYEEEGHRQRSSNVEDTNANEKTDYRDELFLELDSDLAFASSDDEQEMAELLSSDDERRLMQPAHQVTRPFSLAYSHEAESDAESVDLDSNCGSASLVSLGWKSSAASIPNWQAKGRKSAG
ncbi:SPX domain [Fragilaria crotonensis]|nr:SPX domain [Fragilaria crotonensis]